MTLRSRPGELRRQNASDACLLESITTGAATDLPDRGVEALVVPHVLIQRRLEPPAQGGGGELRQEPAPVHLGPQPR